MATFRVVLVEPRNEGNVGAVARVMKNFGVEDLVLVKPCPLGPEARKRAMHGAPILEKSTSVADFNEAVREVDLIVGTSGIETSSEKKFARIAISSADLGTRMAASSARVALVFGREDFGLFAEDVEKCDLLVTIPASSEYPILNISHAAAIVLYELFRSRSPRRSRRHASGLEKEQLHRTFADLLAATDYPAHKRARTSIMFRRLLGRAVPTPWEFHALVGVLQRATKRIARLERGR